jgi:hypothetical protein
MEGKVIEVYKLVRQISELPNGTYKGTFGAYCITIIHNSEKYELKTDVGVRGFGFNAVVNITDNGITFTSN